MVFTFGNNTDNEHVVISLHEYGPMLEQVTNRSEGSNRQVCHYVHFEHSLVKLIRTMDEKELSLYLSKDPICNLEKGIYRVRINIDTLLDQPALKEKEVIRILEVNWDDYQGRQGEQYKLNVTYLQFGSKKVGRLAFHAEEKMGCIRWFWDNFHKINIY